MRYYVKRNVNYFIFNYYNMSNNNYNFFPTLDGLNNIDADNITAGNINAQDLSFTTATVSEIDFTNGVTTATLIYDSSNNLNLTLPSSANYFNVSGQAYFYNNINVDGDSNLFNVYANDINGSIITADSLLYVGSVNVGSEITSINSRITGITHLSDVTTIDNSLTLPSSKTFTANTANITNLNNTNCTFTNPPTCSVNATLSTQLTNKSYVDTAVEPLTGINYVPTGDITAIDNNIVMSAGKAISGTFANFSDITSTGTSSFTGTCSFTNPPTCSGSITTSTQLTNKTYVDAAVAAVSGSLTGITYNAGTDTTTVDNNLTISSSKTFTCSTSTLGNVTCANVISLNGSYLNCAFTNPPTCSVNATTSTQLVNKATLDATVQSHYFVTSTSTLIAPTNAKSVRIWCAGGGGGGAAAPVRYGGSSSDYLRGGSAGGNGGVSYVEFKLNASRYIDVTCPNTGGIGGYFGWYSRSDALSIAGSYFSSAPTPSGTLIEETPTDGSDCYVQYEGNYVCYASGGKKGNQDSNFTGSSSDRSGGLGGEGNLYNGLQGGPGRGSAGTGGNGTNSNNFASSAGGAGCKFVIGTNWNQYAGGSGGGFRPDPYTGAYEEVQTGPGPIFDGSIGYCLLPTFASGASSGSSMVDNTGSLSVGRFAGNGGLSFDVSNNLFRNYVVGGSGAGASYANINAYESYNGCKCNIMGGYGGLGFAIVEFVL
jgi:hypothetical protein